MQRVVVDTNLYFSGLRYRGNPGKLLTLLRPPKFLQLTSEVILMEVHATLLRKSKWSAADIDAAMRTLRNTTFSVSPTERVHVCRDPDDDRILECALAGEASLILSGDKDLLVLGSFNNIPILSLRQFLDSLDSSHTYNRNR